MIENDKAISLWARLLPTYKDHLNNKECTKSTQTTIQVSTLLSILYPDAEVNSKSIARSALSRTKSYINKCLPKGTILTSVTSKEEVEFTFITSDDKNLAHKLLVKLGCTSLQSIDKLLAQMGFIK